MCGRTLPGPKRDQMWRSANVPAYIGIAATASTSPEIEFAVTTSTTSMRNVIESRACHVVGRMSP